MKKLFILPLLLLLVGCAFAASPSFQQMTNYVTFTNTLGVAALTQLPGAVAKMTATSHITNAATIDFTQGGTISSINFPGTLTNINIGNGVTVEQNSGLMTGNGSGLNSIPFATNANQLGGNPSANFITNGFVGDLVPKNGSTFRSGGNGFSETNFFGNGGGLSAITGLSTNFTFTNISIVSAVLQAPSITNATLNGSVKTASADIPVAVTVGASPFSFTNKTAGKLECNFSGSVAYSISKNGVAVYGSLVGDAYFQLSSNSIAIITYSVAPTMFTNSW